MTGLQTQVLVVGAGPAGIAAATAAAEHGQHVILLDDNFAPGGQIWRASSSSESHPISSARQRALARLARSGAKTLSSHRAFDASLNGTLHALHESASSPTVVELHYQRLILATGARERFLPFPGWTLPGVFAAGGLQALVQGGYPVAGKRILVAGTGPLLLAVAAHLKTYGAEIVTVAEQAPLSRLARFSASLIASPSKLGQAAKYRLTLGNTPYHTGCWPLAALANGDNTGIRAVRLIDGNRTWEEPCDLLACGFHLVPNTELAALLGCRLRDSFVEVDAQQRTSLPNLYCVGEPTGIAGLDAALLQGQIAGLACANQPTASLLPPAAAVRRFAARLESAFALRPELKSIATPETIVCRCEDVPLSALTPHTNWTEAKLQTRCGMGPCQGRICGPAVQTLLGWYPVSIRPPIFPVPLHAFCSNKETTQLTEENQ